MRPWDPESSWRSHWGTNTTIVNGAGESKWGLGIPMGPETIMGPEQPKWGRGPQGGLGITIGLWDPIGSWR